MFFIVLIEIFFFVLLKDQAGYSWSHHYISICKELIRLRLFAHLYLLIQNSIFVADFSELNINRQFIQSVKFKGIAADSVFIIVNGNDNFMVIFCIVEF